MEDRHLGAIITLNCETGRGLLGRRGQKRGAIWARSPRDSALGVQEGD